MANIGTLPEDWREWASDDPANHPDGCTCLDGQWCSLQQDAARYYESVASAVSPIPTEKGRRYGH